LLSSLILGNGISYDSVIIPELFKMARLRTESVGNIISISVLLFVALKPM